MTIVFDVALYLVNEADQQKLISRATSCFEADEKIVQGYKNAAICVNTKRQIQSVKQSNGEQSVSKVCTVFLRAAHIWFNSVVPNLF